MTLPWRNCYASVQLVDEVNAKYPKRSKISDGTIGDASHQSRTSDHNLTVKVGELWVVRARDITKVGVDIVDLRERLRALGVAKDERLYPGGYLISDGRITTPDFTGWKTYYGPNQHEHHMHVSFSTVEAGFDSLSKWGIADARIVVDKSQPAQPTIQVDREDPMSAIDIESYSDNTFRGTSPCEAGSSSQVVARAYINVACTYGGSARVTVGCINDAGTQTFFKTFSVSNNRRIPSVEIPSGSVIATVDGTKSPGSMVTASITNIPYPSK